MSEPCRSIVRKGSWSREEDNLLKQCVEKHGEGKWHLVPARAALNRCRKSCRLRWMNYLRPDIRRGVFEEDEINLILRLHKLLGNRWSLIAGRIPGRTANDIKNYWNTNLRKKMAGPTIKSNIGIPVPSQSDVLIIKPRPRNLHKQSNDIVNGMMLKNDHVITSASPSDADLVPSPSMSTQLNDDEAVDDWRDIFWDDFDVQNFLVEEEEEENITRGRDTDLPPNDLATDMEFWDIPF